MRPYSCPVLWARCSIQTADQTIKSISPQIYAAAFIQRFLRFRLYFQLSHFLCLCKVAPQKEAK